jgi:hypothetical protein
MTIFIRDDDVLLPSSGYEDPLKRFKQIHRWILECDRFMHRPTILVTEIQGFPKCIEYVKEETAEGRMDPQIHGLEHIDYGPLSNIEVASHLNQCLDWFAKNKLPRPKNWYTPWGASQPHLHEVSENMGLKLIDTSQINKLPGRYGVVQRLKDGESLDFLEEDEIFMHWWEGGLRLKRVIAVGKHGSFEAAALAEPEIFE